jgi:prophage regulatory protein
MSIDTILRLPQVKARTGLSRSTIYALVKQGKLAPPVPLGARAVGWLESDVSSYIEGCVKSRVSSK